MELRLKLVESTDEEVFTDELELMIVEVPEVESRTLETLETTDDVNEDTRLLLLLETEESI